MGLKGMGYEQTQAGSPKDSNLFIIEDEPLVIKELPPLVVVQYERRLRVDFWVCFQDSEQPC